MKIIRRYLLRTYLRNLSLCLAVSLLLFLLIDFFDRIDNIVSEDASALLTVQYFLFKTPSLLYLMLPLSVLASTMLTVGMLSKDSEITAMRACGVTIFWIARPLLLTGLAISFFALVLNETVIPAATRRAGEIYNIDIRKKDLRGGYSQHDFWWRTKDRFFSINTFDSRSNTLLGLSLFTVNEGFEAYERLDAERVKWIDENLGWSMHDVQELRFGPQDSLKKTIYQQLSLPITEKPEYFYAVDVDPERMNFRRLRKYIKKLSNDGISGASYRADLQAKLAFPFVNFIAVLIALPFALIPARSGNLGMSFSAGLAIGFAYFAVHSFSVSLGRAELLPPFAAAWTANFALGFVGIILNWGAEAP